MVSACPGFCASRKAREHGQTRSELHVQDLKSAFPRFPRRWEQLKTKEQKMTNLILKSLSRLHRDEAGQGLVEYALILALIAFAAVIAMQTLAADINNAFLGIGTILSSYVP